MTGFPAKKVADDYDKLQIAARKIGTKIADPFLQLSFLALPVVPELRLTDRGLVDTSTSKHVSLFKKLRGTRKGEGHKS